MVLIAASAAQPALFSRTRSRNATKLVAMHATGGADHRLRIRAYGFAVRSGRELYMQFLQTMRDVTAKAAAHRKRTKVGRVPEGGSHPAERRKSRAAKGRLMGVGDAKRPLRKDINCT